MESARSNSGEDRREKTKRRLIRRRRGQGGTSPQRFARPRARPSRAAKRPSIQGRVSVGYVCWFGYRSNLDGLNLRFMEGSILDRALLEDAVSGM